MEIRDWLIVASAFFLATGAGFIIQQSLGGENDFSRNMDIRVDNDNSRETFTFDNKTFGLTYENFEEAKFYYNFEDSRGNQEIEDLIHDDSVRTFRDIISFGEDTYLFYFRYRDNASEFGDGWMELYRIEKA